MLCINGDECFKVLDSEKFILFYFTASWCEPCKKITPSVEEISNKLSESINFYKISIDDDANEEICEKCQIKSVPTSYLFKDRKSLGNIIGGDLDNIIKLLNNI